ncbi:serine hydrolase domain-containing protein [Deinococcus soli (ex Cha et al. 2016)]|uniref:Beta-lactamase n=1 Tax=Deinococcus soli (ex Cha et al. 2016) TaxID=1309411 RepID=A0A0F7JNJ6_9DEIO|nr:serine hydrolase domain-containing protein [Deinococcus soli (ex Cha et al. 2016)]AKH17277.1 beta-lactamase [Deinococcus soli (ex Cha et al. 2016)]
MFRDPWREALRDLGGVLGRDLSAYRAPLRAALAQGGVVGAARGDARVVRGVGGVAPGGVFELASVSKPFTAALAGLLVDRGALDWHAPLAALGGPLRGVPRHVTAWTLATHTAGVPLHPARVGVTTFTHFHDPYGPMSPGAVVQSVRRWARPGARFQYSNLGVGLLGLAAARAAGEAFSADGYARALRRDVTGPLGLRVTALAPADVVRPGAGLLTGGQVTGFGPLVGAGGLFGAADDLLNFGAAHLAGQLGGAWRDARRVPGLPPGVEGVAPGWFAREALPGGVRWHDGVARGTRTGLGVHLDRGAVVVVLARGGVPLLGPRAAVPALLRALLEP